MLGVRLLIRAWLTLGAGQTSAFQEIPLLLNEQADGYAYIPAR
jgi:hypothetical protein